MTALRDTLPGCVADFARTTPDRVALREKKLGIWQEYSWRHYHEHVRASARMLWELGIRPGDHVSILSDNCPEWLYADLGAQSIGARAVGIYQTNPPADVAYVLRDSGSKVLFCEDQEQVDKAVEIRDQTPTVEHVVIFDPRGTRAIEDLILDLGRELAIVLVTHDMNQAQRVCDHLACLCIRDGAGEILESACCADLFDNPQCRQVIDYLGQE